MKRSSSEIPSSPVSSAPEDDFKPDSTTSPPKSKRAEPAPQTPTSHTKIKKDPIVSGVSENGEWTAEKKAMMMDTIIAAGYKSTDLDALAGQVSMPFLVRQFKRADTVS